MAVSRKVLTFAALLDKKPLEREFGEMVEWSITPVLKTGVLRGTGGSNPSLSAKGEIMAQNGNFFNGYYFYFYFGKLK